MCAATSVVARTALAALAAVAVAAVARVKMRPQGLIDSDTVTLESVDCGRRATIVRVVDTRDVGRVVVDEVASQLSTEVVVGLRVENECVPPDVDELGRVELAIRLVLDEGKKGQRLVHDALSEVPLDPLVCDDAVDESLPELIVDQVLVREDQARNRFYCGNVHGVHDVPFLSGRPQEHSCLFRI